MITAQLGYDMKQEVCMKECGHNNKFVTKFLCT